MQLRLSLSRAALAISLALSAAACPADTLLTSMMIQDTRLMDLFGTYPATAAPGLNPSIYMFNINSGKVLVSVTFMSPSGERQVSGAGYIKGKGTDGASFKIKAKSDEGYSVKLTATFQPSNNGHFAITGKVSGPDVNSDITATIQPADNARGFLIDDRQFTLGGLQWTATHPAFNGTIKGVRFMDELGPTQLVVEDEGLQIKVTGTIEEGIGGREWVPGSSPAKFQLGKTKLKIPQSRITIGADQFPQN